MKSTTGLKIKKIVSTILCSFPEQLELFLPRLFQKSNSFQNILAHLTLTCLGGKNANYSIKGSRHESPYCREFESYVSNCIQLTKIVFLLVVMNVNFLLQMFEYRPLACVGIGTMNTMNIIHHLILFFMTGSVIESSKSYNTLVHLIII